MPGAAADPFQPRQPAAAAATRNNPSASARYSSLDGNRPGGGGGADLSKKPSPYGGLGGGGGMGGMGGMDGGAFNFQRIMDDHFEHYRRPPSRPASREASVDRLLPAALTPAPPGGSRPPSRPPSRPSSRARAPMLQRSGQVVKKIAGFFFTSVQKNFPLRQVSSSDDFGLPNSVGGGGGGLGGGNSGNGDLLGGAALDDGGLRQRSLAQTPNQEIPNLGTIPKRTESLYMKFDESKVR